MSRFRLIGFSGALVLAALVGGTLMGVASAAPDATTARPAAAMPAAPATDSPPTAGTTCVAFRAALAKELGVTEAALSAATQRAIATTIDAAVAEGKLTKAAADRLRTRLASSPLDGCQKLAKRLERVKPALGVVRDALTAAADAIGMTPAALRAELKSGTSLKTLATSKGVDYATLTSAVLAAVKHDLDAAVVAGTIKQAREDRILARLAARLADGRIRQAP